MTGSGLVNFVGTGRMTSTKARNLPYSRPHEAGKGRFRRTVAGALRDISSHARPLAVALAGG